MLRKVGHDTLDGLISEAVPGGIRMDGEMNLPPALSENQALGVLRVWMDQNTVVKNFIGQGYYGTLTPGVILRNILENPGWYTAYTPYQAEIAQGRLEALLNFQTMITDLTGLDVANASLLDEGTAAAEAVTLALSGKPNGKSVFVSDRCHPQTIDVVKTRCEPLGLEVMVGDWERFDPASASGLFAVIVQYPDTRGRIDGFEGFFAKCHEVGAVTICAADILALTLLKSPGEFGADICVGSSQRFGVPLGFGGPHAGFMACKDALKRKMPGRLIGVSIDAQGKPAYRLSLQTREQHIRREKATSNICTAQVLPAVVASMYAVYHGPEGLTRIARRVTGLAAVLAEGLRRLGLAPRHAQAFDTLALAGGDRTAAILARARSLGMNLRQLDAGTVAIALDETTEPADVVRLWEACAEQGQAVPEFAACAAAAPALVPDAFRRASPFLEHPVFHAYRSETALLRYLRELADRDLALDRTMIPLGSCTMKLNATSEMIPITWPEFAEIHPFAPAEQREGYRVLEQQLVEWLGQATGYAGISLQPNAGSQGEYAGLLAIRAWQRSRGQGHRDICLIPSSAHGTNPASAQMAGMEVVVTGCDADGNVDLAELETKCHRYAERLAAVMITYPSTHGVFERGVKRLCEIVHAHGGRVYVDGANMNALVGLVAPGEFGGDVSHLNLHKTFCIPHGGGGPGVGPVCVVADLVPFLPGHATGGVAGRPVGAVSAAPLGNAAVLPISWMYCRMMGPDGLRQATAAAILAANYVSTRLRDHFPTLYCGPGGRVAHECILDLRPLKETSGVTAEDVAKRLIDYGFHAPTLSFPVAGTLMVEPTESENLAELDRFIEAMIAIRAEIRRVEAGAWPRDDNPLVHAPHTASAVTASDWLRPYTREEAVFPVAALRRRKYWPPVGRVDNVHGDRNLFCNCAPVSAWAE